MDYDKGTETFTVDKTKKEKEKTTILIVDESSMMGEELYEYIQEAIEDEKVKVVLFIRDSYQLLPINKGKNLIYNLPQSYTLKEVVRQVKDSYIIKIATQFRKRIQSKNYIPLAELFYQHASDEMHFFYDEQEFMADFYKNVKWHEEDKIIATKKTKMSMLLIGLSVQNTGNKKVLTISQALLPRDQLRFKNAYSANDITLYHNGQIVEIQSAELNYHQSLGIHYWKCKEYGPTFRVVDPMSLNAFNTKLKSIDKPAKQAKSPQRRDLWKAFY
ncbi:MAG: AAA family ATPase [Sulfurimonas sp.]